MTDFESMLDLNRTKLTQDLVDQMEEALRLSQRAAEDMRAVVATAKDQEFPLRDIAAMKQIAKLRLQDKRSEAQDKLEALERVGKAVGFDLFDWDNSRR